MQLKANHQAFEAALIYTSLAGARLLRSHDLVKRLTRLFDFRAYIDVSEGKEDWGRSQKLVSRLDDTCNQI